MDISFETHPFTTGPSKSYEFYPPLRRPTPAGWIEAVLNNFDAFLLDHASCERKASAQAMSLVVRYPDRAELVDTMIGLAREELEHFHQVYRLVHARGLILANDEKDPYVNYLHPHLRHGRDERLLDRLIVSSVIEARGHERLGILATHLKDPPLKAFYTRLMNSEGGHRKIFLRLAELYFPTELVKTTVERFLDLEAEAIAALPVRPAFH